MTDQEAIAAARRAVKAFTDTRIFRRDEDAVTVDIEQDAKVIHMDDPPGVAVQAWVYVMTPPGEPRG